MARVIFHIDLNCYFASAEVNRNPSLEGKPIVVAGLSKRSVVCTASYEARKYGVHAAMPVFQALDLCPDLVVVEIDHAYYEQLSFKFFKYLKQFSKKIEIASIDECYMDVTEEIKQYKCSEDIYCISGYIEIKDDS